jgi:hypothetical protein
MTEGDDPAGSGGDMPPDPVPGIDMAWIQIGAIYYGLRRGMKLWDAACVIAAYIDLQGRKVQDDG